MIEFKEVDYDFNVTPFGMYLLEKGSDKVFAIVSSRGNVIRLGRIIGTKNQFKIKYKEKA